MAQDPYYWHYRCPASVAPFRADIIKVTEEQAAAVLAGKISPPVFNCELCGKEHEGYLQRSKFGSK
jgi:hypothetical protein